MFFGAALATGLAAGLAAAAVVSAVAVVAAWQWGGRGGGGRGIGLLRGGREGEAGSETGGQGKMDDFHRCLFGRVSGPTDFGEARVSGWGEEIVDEVFDGEQQSRPPPCDRGETGGRRCLTVGRALFWQTGERGRRVKVRELETTTKAVDCG